jgi:hypothetical protein
MTDSYPILAYCLLTSIAFMIAVPRSRSGLGIWEDLDRVFVWGALALARFLSAPVPTVNEATRQAAHEERIFAGRMAAAGILLLMVFPFHRIFATDPLLDALWTPVQALSQAAHDTSFEGLIHVAPDWRYSEYYLWEVAAFLWTMVQIGSSHLREIKRLLADRLMEPTAAFALGGIYVTVAFILAILGIVILVIAVSLYVLIFEAFVVLLFTIMEVSFARTLFRNGRNLHALRGIESALFIEVPAFLAFVLAALFVGSAEGFTASSSHWSHAFASGASALDLVLANVGLLMIRTFRQPAPEFTPEELERKETVGG